MYVCAPTFPVFNHPPARGFWMAMYTAPCLVLLCRVTTSTSALTVSVCCSPLPPLFASASSSAATNEMEAQDECGKWRQIPAFGDWNHLWEDMPVTQYFDPAATFFFTAQAGEDDVDLFKVPHFAANPYTYKKCVVRVKKGEEKAKEGGAPVPARKKVSRKQQQRQGKDQHRRKPKAAAVAVDEDLYKISPNVICKVQKKKLLRNLLGGCLGLNCIA